MATELGVRPVTLLDDPVALQIDATVMINSDEYHRLNPPEGYSSTPPTLSADQIRVEAQKQNRAFDQLRERLAQAKAGGVRDGG